MNINSEKTSLIVAEYNSLRGEIVSRIGIRQNLLSLTLLVFGTLMGASLQPKINTSILLIYPIISSFLSISWVYNDLRIKQLANYIREIETSTKIMGWSLYLKDLLSNEKFIRVLSPLSTSGLFISTQILSVAIAILNHSFSLIEWVLFIIDIIFIITTVILSGKTKGWKL